MTPRRADWTLLLATAIWGVTFPVVKRGLAEATPLAFLALRFGIASVLLLPTLRHGTRPGSRELAGGALLGGLVAVGFMTQHTGLVDTTPSRSAFIVAVSSILAPVIAFALLGERPRWPVAVALALAGGGVYLLTAPDTSGLNRGDLWTLACAVCFGGQIVAVTELVRRYDPRRLVWAQLAATALLAALGMMFLERPAVHWSWTFVAILAYVAVFASAIAFALQMRAQRYMSSARAALIFCIEPVFAAGTSWLVLGERLSLTQWLGGGVILVGMVLAEMPTSDIRHQTSEGSGLVEVRSSKPDISPRPDV
jgi:drug/metabolite transporter (DMT)-like permease